MKTTSIKIEGQIISSEIFDKIDSAEIHGQLPKDFGFESGTKVKDEIQRAWANAKDQWKIFNRNIEKLGEDDIGTTETRKYWIIPFLDNLGYQLNVGKAETVNEKSYAISHRAGNIDNFPVHIVSYKDSLDKRREGSGPRLSPHALVQEYLNLTEHLYALVTNGYQLRVLRDSGKLIRLTYLEFDLQKMMEEDLYAEFSIMYRFIHASRMPQKMDEGDLSLIEQYHQDSLEAGARIRDKLSEAVEKSIQLLADGFLNNRNNEELRKQIEENQLDAEKLYQYLLRFIYRVLFLMVIEERDIVYPENGKENKYYKDIYYDNYSISRLRKLSEKIFFFNDKLNDLWIQLRNTFKIFGDERLAEKLKLYPLDGELFDFGALGILSESDLDNRALLSCIKNLSQFEDKETHSVIRVNYSALNVEEFGSVYEELLEKDPSITKQGNNYKFTFVKGSERSSSGSHYTPEELVQPLIKHSLDYVIEDKLKLAKNLANSEWRVVNGELAVEGKNSDLVNEGNFNINEVIKNEFISRFGSLETRDGNSGDDLQVNGSISERGNIRTDLSNSESSKFDSGKSGGRLGETGNEGVSSIHPDSNRESEGTGNSSSINSKSGDHYSSSDRTDSGTMRNSEQANAESSEKSFSQDEINNWWINLPNSNRQSLLANHLLLSIKVCDVACGSGHILLSAARRIAQELTRVRTGEDQPSPGPFREAIRDVINNCIYGVDKNPLAVELCKVALWLEAHNPGMPLNFLDNKIRCGDSIVGLGRIEELQNGIATEAFKTLPGDDKTIASEFRKKNKEEQQNRDQYTLTDKEEVIEKLNNISVKFKSFNELPDNTVEAVRKKAEEFDVLKGTDWWHLKEAADLQVAQFFIPKDSSNKNFLTTDRDYFRILAGDKAKHERQISTARAVGAEKKFFHWFLEFPEVFNQRVIPAKAGISKSGFDCILGNPPFLGGQRLTGTFGNNFLEWVKTEFAPAGSCDLVTYFFRRIFELLSLNGFQALISTNTVAQGNAREGGLDVIVKNNGVINFAIRSMRWPGTAAVEVSLVAIHKGEWKKERFLGNKKVDFISPYLDDTEVIGDPYPLKQNEGKSFQGSIVLGKGFVLTPNEAQKLIEKDPKNKDVLFPYLNGEDLNTNPDQSPSRWVINFFDWPLRRAEPDEWNELTKEEKEKARKERIIAPPDYKDKVASDYPDCLAIVERDVKPERLAYDERKNAWNKSVKTYWWRFGAWRVELAEKISGMGWVLVVGRVTKYLSFAFQDSDLIFADQTVASALNRTIHFDFVNNTLFDIWAWKNCSTMGSSTLRFAISDAFETFPFPQNLTKETEEELEKIGEEYHEFRRKLMLDLQLGLTKTYNLFHNPEVSSQRMANGDWKRLRRLENLSWQICRYR